MENTPAQPQGNQPSAAPTPKKRSPFVWILLGCAGFILIGGLVASVFVWWGYHKAKDYVNRELGDFGNMKTVAELWSDVPRMEGMTPTQKDMPLPVKLLFGKILGNLGRLNKEGEDRSTGSIDWLVFTTAAKPDDLQTFYTPDRMTQNGWEHTEKSCVSGSEQGFPQVGVFCVFQKNQNRKMIQLAIVAWEDSTTRETNIFFLRLTPDQPTSEMERPGAMRSVGTALARTGG